MTFAHGAAGGTITAGLPYFVRSALVVLGTLLPVSASAEPITGFFEVIRSGWALGGGGFSQGSVGVGLSNFGRFDAACEPCVVGQQVSFSGMFTHDDRGITFYSPLFSIPEVSPGELLTVQMPFQFDAFGRHKGQPIYLSGGGTVTGQFHAYSLPSERGPFYMWRHAQYVAGAEPAVTPEPTSLLLLGTGVSVLWARARRRSAVDRSRAGKLA